MATLGLIQVSAGAMESNLELSLAQEGEKPWALDRFMKQMRGLQEGAFIAFAWVTNGKGGPLGRSGPVQDDAQVRRMVIGRITRSIRPTESLFFEGFPYEFWYELLGHLDQGDTQTLEEAASRIREVVAEVDLDGPQLKEMISNGRSSKVGMFVDGGVRRADYFKDYPDPTSAPGARPLPQPKSTGEEPSVNPGPLPEAAQNFSDAVDAAGLIFDGINENLPLAFFASLVTKPFAILTGLSGSGKTQLALTLGKWLGTGDDGSPCHLVVPVRADWTSPEPLLGFEDLLLPASDGRRGWNVPAVLEFVLRAQRNPDRLWLLVLDEMNLAHVERYFADVLSGIESREPVVPNLRRETDGVWRIDESGPDLLPIPTNLLLVGTVNVDETTYQFSPKVLDRAFSFEFRVASEELEAAARPRTTMRPASESDLAAMQSSLSDVSLPAFQGQEDIHALLVDLHQQLTEIGLEFGHRTMQESMRFANRMLAIGLSDGDTIWDWVVMTKILPRVHGSRRQLEEFLQELGRYSKGADDEKPQRPLVARKASRMLRALRENQFTGFSD